MPKKVLETKRPKSDTLHSTRHLSRGPRRSRAFYKINGKVPAEGMPYQLLHVRWMTVNGVVRERYFSYRAILAAIVSRNHFVLVFMRYRYQLLHVRWMTVNGVVRERYFSYCAILVAIVSRNHFVLVFYAISHTYCGIRCAMGYRTEVVFWN